MQEISVRDADQNGITFGQRLGEPARQSN